MPRIQELPQSVVNKIAAGEVIERPASVVKELMENAIDAGATRIDVAVEAGGVDLVRVVDNGCGMTAEELPLAVASHATSKIATADDLFRVGTLGFRGEALASIAAVSRLVLRSRAPESPSGAELEVAGGELGPVAPCGCPVGTTVEVRNLFFNTPVRRKFLRSPQTELGHTSEAFVRIALAAPNVHFTLRHDHPTNLRSVPDGARRPVFDLPGSEGMLERIARVFGRELAQGLIWVESVHGPVRLAGYVAHPSQSRSNNRMQYLFLNGRCIRDRSLQHALGEAYRGLLMAGRFPIALLSLEMPPELVDVNVHPTKLEVRFQDSGQLYSQLLATLRTKFLSTDLTTQVQTASDLDPSGAHDEPQAAGLRQRLVDWAKGEVQSWGSRPGDSAVSAGAPGSSGPWMAAGPHPEEAPPGASPPAAPLELARLERSWAPVGRPEDEEQGENPPEAASDWAAAAVGAGRGVKALQIHNRYLVAESDDGVMVIDQHALHERILYERLRERVLAGAIESQTLLVPQPVDLSPAETAAALEHRELLAQLGVGIEPFGGQSILVTSYPAMLANMEPVEVLRGLVDQLLAGGKLPDRRDLLDDLLHTIACKAAIKAGDRLSAEEVAALLAERHLIADPHHCPHGRPAALVFTREELDKQFRRA